MIQAFVRPPRPGTVLCLFCAGLLACNDLDSTARSAANQVSIDTLQGKVLVNNGESGIWEPDEAWAVTEELRIGSLEGPEEELFTNFATSVSLGPQGQLFVLDVDAGRISVFDREGNYLRHFGRRGRGPGEFSTPASMIWDGMARLWVPEGHAGRYTVFDSMGVFLKTEPRVLRISARVQHLMKNDGGGQFIDEGAREDAVLFIRVDTAGQVLDTLAPVRFPEFPRAINGMILSSSHVAIRQVSRYYFPRLIWSLGPDNTVWTSESGNLTLTQRSLEGDTLRIIETRHREVPLSRADERIISLGLAEVGLDRSDVRVVRPVIQSIHVLEDGHLLVQIVETIGEDSSLFDVFDPEGRFLGPLRFPVPITSKGMPAIFGDTLVGVTLGEFDEPYVVRVTIHRPRN